MCLGFEARAQRHQLRAVAHQFAQLASRWWGDPRLRQPVHPQQVRQIAGVTDVVLDTPVPKSLDTQRVCQVDSGAGRLQGVDRPIPAIRCLKHHVRVLTGLLQLQCQRVGIVDDPHRRQSFTGTGLAHDHRMAPVQIDPNELFSVILVHRGPPTSCRI